KQTVTASYSYTCTAGFSYTLDTATGRYTFTSTSFSSAPPSPSVENYRWTVDGVYRGAGLTLSTMLSPGQHNVCLEMTRPGCGDSVCKTVIVPPSQACTTRASISYSAEPGNPNRIRFSASPNLPNAFYYWNIGGNNYFTREVTHVYAGAGTYPVWLSVTDSASRCSDSLSQYITVQAGPADSCVVSLTHRQNPTQNNIVSFSVNSNQPIQFMQGHIEYPDGSGDSLFLNQPHVLPDTGTYIAQLTVRTQTGCVRTVYDTVRVTSTGSNTNTVIPCFPNPATNMVTMQFRLPESLKMVISVHNTSGVEMKSMVQIGWRGNVVLSIPVDDLQPGQYFIQIVFPETYPIQRKSSIFQKL
ncbi:MAG TPA: PKD domain-containing protein, partial [Flavisolibacter sp.]